MRVDRLSAFEWSQLSKNAHSVVFNEAHDPDEERIHFALMVVETDTPVAYMTVRELGKKTAYLQYGGSFPSARGTINSYKSYLMMLNRLNELGFKDLTTYIENTNLPMLKFAMKAGWRIIGTRNFDGSIMVEHHLKF